MVVRPTTGNPVDRSGTTATTSDAVIAPLDSARKFLYFQNLSDTKMHLAFGEAAVADVAIPIEPAGTAGDRIRFDASYAPSGAAHLLCTATAKKYICKTG